MVKGLGQDFSDRTGFRHRGGLGTPCNGVLINWEPSHDLFRTMLRVIDESYDPGCWGCLGPRLLGKVLLWLFETKPCWRIFVGLFAVVSGHAVSVRLRERAFACDAEYEETENFVRNISA